MNRTTLSPVFLTLVLTGCSSVSNPQTQSAEAQLRASTVISNPAKELVGRGTFTNNAGESVTLSFVVTGCPAGEHGLHIHAGTSCGSDGSEALDHWDPLGAGVHGQVGEAAPHHAGDVGVLSCGEDGSGSLTITTDEWTLAVGESSNPIGQAMILHGLDAKQRIGCGVIAANGTIDLAATTLTQNPAADISGTARFVEVPTGEVTVDVELAGCPEGSHGLHIHAGTSCGPDGQEAQGHWDPHEVGEHGQVGESAPHHAGDVGVVECGADGNGSLSLTTDEWVLSDGDSELNPVGQAAIVHGIDPANRVACGVIEGS